MHYQASYYCRPLGLSPAGEILTASAAARHGYSTGAEGEVVFVWAALSLGQCVLALLLLLLTSQMAKQVGSRG